MYVNRALPHVAPVYAAPARWKSVALHVTAVESTWREVFWGSFAHFFQPVLIPVLLVASKLLHRPFSVGVVWHDAKVLDVEVIDETPEA